MKEKKNLLIHIQNFGLNTHFRKDDKKQPSVSSQCKGIVTFTPKLRKTNDKA